MKLPWRRKGAGPRIDPAQLAAIAWWHSIELAPGIVTPGRKGDAGYMAGELARVRLPDLSGKSVLDVGAWDGFYSFEAERRGAASVVALDGFVWQLELRELWMAQDRGERLPALRFDPECESLPGRAGFDFARRALGSRVEPLVMDVMDISPAIGVFDVALYLGVLYHMENPLEALRRLASVTRELAIVETQAIEIPSQEHLALCEFYAGDELASDPSNWWAPNRRALEGMLLAAGFCDVQISAGGGQGAVASGEPVRHRLIAHAYK